LAEHPRLLETSWRFGRGKAGFQRTRELTVKVNSLVNAQNTTILLEEMQLNKEPILFDDGRRIS
jgi:hypothetical protein